MIDGKTPSGLCVGDEVITKMGVEVLEGDLVGKPDETIELCVRVLLGQNKLGTPVGFETIVDGEIPLG